MDILAIRKKASKAISPLVSADTEYFGGRRTLAGHGLPEYYLVYFLLVDLLRFENLGRHEKIAWSVPVDFEGHLMYIEYRKFGLGVFCSSDNIDEEAVAREVVKRIKNGVKVAQPYYDWRAKEAVGSSHISVRNQANYLYDRFQYFLQAYKSKCTEIEQSSNDIIRTTNGDGLSFTFSPIGPQLERESEWLAYSAIESFFSWTEHVFIQLAILQGKCVTGDRVRTIARADWKVKFKVALDIRCPSTKRFYDGLTMIRNQVRNFVAHGAFGKDSEAFMFHSGAGAVPVKMPDRGGKYPYRFRNQLDINQCMSDREAIALIEEFIAYIRAGELSPAWIYVDSYMDTVLTFAEDGRYGKAMASEDAMNDFVEYLSYLEDVHDNMDF